MAQIAYERVFGDGGRGQYFLEEPAFLQGTFEGREWLNSSQDEEEERKTLLTTSNTVFDP